MASVAELVKAAICGVVICRFESYHSPKIVIFVCGAYSSVVER